MPATTAIFAKNPVSSSRMRGGGKSYRLFSETPSDGTNSLYVISWEVPENDGKMDYDAGEIVIDHGSQELYRYSTEGAVQLRTMPAGLKQRIVDDFNSVAYRKEEEITPEEKGEMTRTVIKTESKYGKTVQLIYVQNSLDIRARDMGGNYYTVSSDSYGTTTKEYGMFATEGEAQSTFDHQIRGAVVVSDKGSRYDYNGVAVDYDDLKHVDGSDHATMVDIVSLTGEGFQYREEYVAGSELKIIDQWGRRDFGTLTLNVETDKPMIEAYIDAKQAGPRTEDPDYVPPTVANGLQTIHSWGWYETNKDSMYNPFEKIELVDAYTISNTNGRILGLDDDDIWPIESGAIHLQIKENFRVRMTIMTQDQSYFNDMIMGLDQVALSIEEYDLMQGAVLGQGADYENTSKVQLDLFAGDKISVDIDGNVAGIANFRITHRGEQIVKGAPRNINDEFFMRIDEIEYQASGDTGGGGSGGGGGGSGGGGSSSKPMNPIGIFLGVLAIGVILFVALRPKQREEE